MNTFDPLTLALENWFASSLCDLPDSLRQRVKKEFAPMPWDQLAADQRRTVTLQLDYQHDPATEQDRQFWWDHYWRQDELKAQIAQWESAAAPTAGELVLRETRLKELQQELARTKAQERQARGDYYPERKPLDGASETSPIAQGSPVLYVAYPKAMAQLRKRLDATPDELAAWIWIGPKDGGIAAYVSANELDPPPRFHFGLGSGKGDDHDYVSPLMACWFRADEIAGFKPADRYITCDALIKRWSDRPGLKPEAWVRAKIRESRLSDLHPLYGGTQGSWPEDASLPPLTNGLFPLSEVRAIEAEDFDFDWQASAPMAGPAATPSVPFVGSAASALAGPNTGGGRTAAPPATDVGQEATRETAGVLRFDPAGVCTVFIAMKGLAAEEVCLAFVGDKAADGMGANNMIEIAARQQTTRVALAALDLVDRRQGQLNSLGAVLLGMAQGKKFTHSVPNATKMTRLRALMRKHLGLTGDPFLAYRESLGWQPRFKILDKRGAADERARRDAEQRSESYDQLLECGGQFSSEDRSNTDADEEGDAAARWLSENDPNGRA